MSELTAVFTVLGGLAFVLANIAIWSPRKLRVKMGALATAAVFLPAAYMSLSEMLSRPKPVGSEWARRELAEATVIGSQLVEGQAIYLWLGIEGVEEPRAYALPWDENVARQLHGARRNAEANGTKVKMRDPFEQSNDERERVFYAAPQAPPPQKQRPAESPLQHQHSQANQDRATN
ncbi:MAG: hypothetical protein ACTSQ7_11315 [Alphaproteobacteria bacterium]